MIKKGVFQITVDYKSLQIKIAITNFVFFKLLQNVIQIVISKIKILKNILLNNIIKRSLYNSQLGLLLNPDLFNNSIASRQCRTSISFHLIAMINQLIYLIDIVVMEYSVHVYWFGLYNLWISEGTFTLFHRTWNPSNALIHIKYTYYVKSFQKRKMYRFFAFHTILLFSECSGRVISLFTPYLQVFKGCALVFSSTGASSREVLLHSSHSGGFRECYWFCICLYIFFTGCVLVYVSSGATGYFRKVCRSLQVRGCRVIFWSIYLFKNCRKSGLISLSIYRVHKKNIHMF